MQCKIFDTRVKVKRYLTDLTDDQWLENSRCVFSQHWRERPKHLKRKIKVMGLIRLLNYSTDNAVNSLCFNKIEFLFKLNHCVHSKTVTSSIVSVLKYILIATQKWIINTFDFQWLFDLAFSTCNDLPRHPCMISLAITLGKDAPQKKSTKA